MHNIAFKLLKKSPAMSMLQKGKRKTAIPVINLRTKNIAEDGVTGSQQPQISPPEPPASQKVEPPQMTQAEPILNLKTCPKQVAQPQTSQREPPVNQKTYPKQVGLPEPPISQRSYQKQTVYSSSHPVKATKKFQGPETWADETVQSQSQKLKGYAASEAKRRQEDMENQVNELEAQLLIMGSLLEKREKIMKEAAEEAEKKQEELEKVVQNQEATLIMHNIDPVTGEVIPLGEDGEIKVESTKKITKKRIQEMKEKLHQMNSQTDSYLAEIQNTLQYLDSLEVTTAGSGHVSDKLLLEPDDVLNRITFRQNSSKTQERADNSPNMFLAATSDEKLKDNFSSGDGQHELPPAVQRET